MSDWRQPVIVLPPLGMLAFGVVYRFYLGDVYEAAAITEHQFRVLLGLSITQIAAGGGCMLFLLHKAWREQLTAYWQPNLLDIELAGGVARRAVV